MEFDEIKQEIIDTLKDSNDYEEVMFEPLIEIKKERETWARKQGIEPHKTWYEIEAEEKKLEGLPF